MTEEEHVHKFNATLVDGHGRCACGAWARRNRIEKCWGGPIQHVPSVKGLETRLRRLQDPNFEYPTYPKTSPAVVAEKERDFTAGRHNRDLVSIYGDPSTEKF